MSTQIAEIEGEHEGAESKLDLTQFYGGIRRGLCLQLTVPYNHDGWIELNKKQVQQLVKELQNWLGEIELPWHGGWRKKQDVEKIYD